jgi:hypothetical protein
MRKFLFVVLSFIFLSAEAQKKISYELLFSSGAVFTRSKPITIRSPGRILIDPNTGMATTVPGTTETSNLFKNVITPYVTLGFVGNYYIRQDIRIHGGLSFSYLDIKRKNIIPLTNPLNGNSTYDYLSTEMFKFYTLNIPMGVSYLKNKWVFEIGITPSVILNSKSYNIEEPTDPEVIPLPPQPDPTVPQPSRSNETKMYVSLSITPSYQISKKFRIGLEYNHGLSNTYSTNKYSKNVYQSMKVSNLGLKIFYKIK